MVTAKGMLFLSRGGVRLTRDAKHEPTLTLLCVSRIANHQVEPWALFWKGDEAAAFYAAHSADLTAGAPLTVEACNLRAHSTGRTVEITARVISCALAPAAQPKAAA